jgi:hypothetical protein
MALTLLGADGVITSLTENSQNARVCNQLYDLSRQSLLRSHPWNFAFTRVAAYPEWDELMPYGEGARVVFEDVVYEALRTTTIGADPDETPADWKTTTLVVLEETDVPVDEWAAAFILPTDCLRVLYVNSTRDKFRVEGRRLLTMTSDVVLNYITDEDDPAAFDPLFIRALAYRIAIDAAPALANSRRALELEDHFRKVIMPEATSADAFESEGDAYIRSEWEDARL